MTVIKGFNQKDTDVEMGESASGNLFILIGLPSADRHSKTDEELGRVGGLNDRITTD